MPNRLAQETSPYLLQHADNPVDWQPWDEQALTQARREQRPILLSIGYSACHWCHVMAHECFEDADVAAVMNRLFVNIKVDREERPDLDHIYQTAHQMLTGRAGGWPLTVFLTPDGEPFFAGTYFPKAPRHGLPGFPQLCERIIELFRTQGPAIAEQSQRLGEALAATLPIAAKDDLDAAPIGAHRDGLMQRFDRRHGGFGGAPKFPHPTDLAFLLGRRDAPQARQAALATLTAMAHGGIYDQLGGGFFRYSVDERWEIPHFEKMLYDNALLLGVYADAWVLTGDASFARVVEETAAWLLRDMQLPEGGFASSLDADSEGEEGRYYLWDRDEVAALLDREEWQAAAAHWGLAAAPNFEHERWHLRVAAPLADVDADRLASARAKLFAARARRVVPGRDDKVLTAWNALTIGNLARAARIFERGDWLLAARRALDFILHALFSNGRLLATWRSGRAHLPAYLDDHAFLLAALLEMMQSEFRADDLAVAGELARTLLDRFEDAEDGGFFFTADDHEALIHRPKPAYDNALPAGNGVAAASLLRLGSLLGDERFSTAAERTLRLFRHHVIHGGCATLALATEEWLRPAQRVVLRGPANQVEHWASQLARLPAVVGVVLPIPNGTTPLPASLRQPESDSVNAWVCQGVTCLPPLSDIDELQRQLASVLD